MIARTPITSPGVSRNSNAGRVQRPPHANATQQNESVNMTPKRATLSLFNKKKRKRDGDGTVTNKPEKGEENMEEMRNETALSQPLTPTKGVGYKYTTLKDLVVGEDFNFYGVLFDISFPVPCKGKGDLMVTMKLIDKSISVDKLFIVNMFYKQLDKLPAPGTLSLGDIVRFHRCEVQEYHDKSKGTKSLQGIANWENYSGVVVFSGETGKEIWKSSKTITYTEVRFIIRLC